MDTDAEEGQGSIRCLLVAIVVGLEELVAGAWVVDGEAEVEVEGWP